MSYAQRSPGPGRAHSTAREESVKRVSVLFGMFIGQSNTRAASAAEVLGPIPRNNTPCARGCYQNACIRRKKGEKRAKAGDVT